MKTKNLFISHSWNYSNQYDNLKRLLSERPYFKYKDFSVPKDDPVHTGGTDKELIKAIRNKMQFCHVILILAGVYSTYSKWIGKEIKIATDDFGKPIIAIAPWGSERTSLEVKNVADKIVKWNTDSIVAAIRELT